MYPTYQFLGAAYIKTQPNELDISLNSINSQIYKSLETILIIDGEVTNELKNVLTKYQNIMKIRIIELKENVGLGPALRIGLKYCTAEYILRFDTDDYNLPNRAIEQINYISKGDFDLVSSWIYEFEDDHNYPLRIKKVPLDSKRIYDSIYYRNPFNHPSVCFKRKVVINLNGGYRDRLYYEDYDLWIRAILNGCKVSNMSQILVGMKSNNLINSRRGFKLVLCESKLLETFMEKSFLEMLKFLPFFIIRSIIRLLPFSILQQFYRKILRSK